MQCPWNIWPQLSPKLWKSSGVIIAFSWAFLIMLSNRSCDWYDSLPSLVSYRLYVLLWLLCFTLTFSSVQTNFPSTSPLYPSLPSLHYYLSSPLLSCPAVMSKGQRVSCLLLCCQCSCLLLRCLLALAFSCCPSKCEAPHWNSWWRKDDLTEFISSDLNV